MTYFAPYIDGSGLNIPTYDDILNNLLESYKSIYGQDSYLENDSADYQFISIMALSISDTLQAAQLAYNNTNPVTATGTGLDVAVKVNGLKRKSPSYSTCTVNLAGLPNAIINNGIAKDISGNKWSLPSQVVLDNTGNLTTTVTCQTIGAITAQISDINIIDTPTYGWTSITNPSAAAPGQSVEVDSQLKQRQSISTAIPSQAPLDATIAAIAAVSGVTRYKIYENDTNAADSNGLPAHSITSVVEGGSDIDIATAIKNKKNAGCYTNGDQVVNITGLYGNIIPIRFYRPSYVDIDISITIKKLTGYTTATNAAIKAALTSFLNTPQIGDDLAISALWYTAMSVNPNLAEPLFSITSLQACRHGGSLGTSDIITTFKEVLRGNSSYIEVIETT